MIPIKSTQIEVATNKALDCVVLWIPIDSGVRDVSMGTVAARALAERIIASCDMIDPSAEEDRVLARRSAAIESIALFEKQLARTPEDIFPERFRQIANRLNAAMVMKQKCDEALDGIDR